MTVPVPYPFGTPGTCLLCEKGKPCDPEIHRRYAEIEARYNERQMADHQAYLDAKAAE